MADLTTEYIKIKVFLYKYNPIFMQKPLPPSDTDSTSLDVLAKQIDEKQLQISKAQNNNNGNLSSVDTLQTNVSNNNSEVFRRSELILNDYIEKKNCLQNSYMLADMEYMALSYFRNPIKKLKLLGHITNIQMEINDLDLEIDYINRRIK